MQDVNIIYNNAGLALAAYADLLAGNTADQALALQSAGMSQAQAEEFAARFPNIVTQYTSTDTGLSATVFRDASGELHLALRGTEVSDLDDLATDIDISLQGAGYDQIVDMYNWWQRVSAAPGEAVQQFELASFLEGTEPDGAIMLFRQSAGGFSSATYLVPGSTEATGELSGQVAGGLDVSGHSLGGHLTAAFNGLFPGVVDAAYTFNAPGFVISDTNQTFFTALGGQVPSLANDTSVHHVIADEAGTGAEPFSAVAGLHFTSNPFGSVDQVPIENQWLSGEPVPPLAFNHSQMVLVDSLAVYNMLYQLDDSLDLPGYEQFFQQVSNKTFASLENMVELVAALFGVENAELDDGNTHRDAMYQVIYGIFDEIFVDADAVDPQLKTEYQSLRVVDSASLEPAATSDTGDGFAYRYALLNLVPFAVTGNAALYDRHNLNGELDGENFSEGYLADRALMLSAIIQRNEADTKHPERIDGDAILFNDADIGTVFAGANAAGQGGTNTLSADDVTNIVFGNNEDNGLLIGHDNNDRFEGAFYYAWDREAA